MTCVDGLEALLQISTASISSTRGQSVDLLKFAIGHGRTIVQRGINVESWQLRNLWQLDDGRPIPKCIEVVAPPLRHLDSLGPMRAPVISGADLIAVRV